ncbi:MAG: tRNA (guanosine(46)-N7)-methyltransferase TrmB [Planctomycetota bacterium]
MSDSRSASRQLDVTGYGFSQDDLPDLDHGPLDLREWFRFGETIAKGASDTHGEEHPAANPGGEGKVRPLDLEIGSGKGTFLTQQAGLEPGVDFLGIEWAKTFWRHAADRARRHAFPNVRLLWADATVFVRNYVGDASLRRVHIYFPDPWPKKRHQKRRSVQAPFLRELHRVLEPGGEIRLATDHAEYFAWMQEHAAQVDGLFERRPFERPASAGEGELVGTNFERKYIREGRPFNAMVLAKR